jgi:hypothetical protein
MATGSDIDNNNNNGMEALAQFEQKCTDNKLRGEVDAVSKWYVDTTWALDR